MTTDTKLQKLIINKLTTSDYSSINEKDPNQLYLVTDALGFDNTITNCLTHIPQDINLELVDGTLTLKAGSKVYFPNGFEADGTTPKFDVVTIDSDRTYTWSGTGSGFVMVYTNGQPTISSTGSETVDSFTPSQSYKLIYNTTDNKCYFDNSTSTLTQVSFPIARFTASGQITSIDKIFNGFGYIGSTIFALPGVRGRIPNYKNADGSYKSIEYVSQNVITRTFASSYSISDCLLLFTPNRPNYSFSVIYPEGVVTQGYDIKINNFKSDLFTSMAISIGSISLDSGKITSVILKTTFQAVDRNDTSWLSELSMPEETIFEDLSLPAGGTQMTAPATGYVQLWMTSTTTTGYVQLASGAMLVYEHSRGGTGPMVITMEVRKGQKFAPQYQSSNTLNRFRFIYAVGEVE